MRSRPPTSFPLRPESAISVCRGFSLALLTVFGWLSPASAAADGQFPEVTWHGLLDLRYQHSDAAPGELEQGLGKLRAGGERARWRLNEAAATLQVRLDWDWMLNATVKYADRQSTPLDLTEAYLAYRPVGAAGWRLAGRLGMFFPPISLENTGTAWSSPYTLSSSTINAWVGEELRAFGGELRVDYQTEAGDKLGVFGAVLANNDTAGLMLAWRGWSLHDFESTLTGRLRLPEGIAIPALFPKQANASQTFVEVDGRPGFYAGIAAERPQRYTLRALYYDNNADPAALSAGQYGWHTRFWSLGAKAELPWETTLISQAMTGRTSMGELLGDLRAVDVGFWSASWLLSRPLGDGRFSVRYERFGSDERDYLPQDRNGEHGQAWTVNYNLTFAQHHQLNVEFSRIFSARPARQERGEAAYQEDTLWQVAYRLFF
ncbi:hypothetical protein [Methylomonas sp. UP202]|uniref:hypothetical protein n=1 Tax=Methylomonas sp. UP202 TaxID=3040943 RepID=UPI00247A9CF0|nr:hypothetical protein [Methylomonas sp. UP202]WGS87343.1 hypothetical protein QC632_06215 [Methylomonas sp. UP202]